VTGTLLADKYPHHMGLNVLHELIQTIIFLHSRFDRTLGELLKPHQIVLCVDLHGQVEHRTIRRRRFRLLKYGTFTVAVYGSVRRMERAGVMIP
jgi:hypothetical protein